MAEALPNVTMGRIDLADAKRLLDEKSAVFVDVRDPEAYDRSHIQGALSAPLAALQARTHGLPTGHRFILYCT